MIRKRIFDVLLSFILLVLLFVPMCLLWIVMSVSLKSNGLFLQTRIGQHGRPFIMYKFKTLYSNREKKSKLGAFLRSTKIDEFPQFLNILKGDMSFVGPRPDLPGYYDTLVGENRILLKLKPGLTSEAALKYIKEEKILTTKENPKGYNDSVIYPDKIEMNLHYYYNRSFLLDLKILLLTLIMVLFRKR